jgi:hypothetical protein
MSKTDNGYAMSWVRDRFLVALDCRDEELSLRLARGLTECGNPLPSSTCRELGLPIGSSYGCGAREVIQRNGAMQAGCGVGGDRAAEEDRAGEDRIAPIAFSAEGDGVDDPGERRPEVLS